MQPSSLLYHTSLCWFRRDLRLFDHAALFHALCSSSQVIPVFVFDRTILDPLPSDDRRITFIWHSLRQLQDALRQYGSDLVVKVGDPREVIPKLAEQLGAQAVFANRGYEPGAIERDTEVQRRLALANIEWSSHKDQVIFEKDELRTAQRRAYTVFTPYKRAWLNAIHLDRLASYTLEPYLTRLKPFQAGPLPSMHSLGFEDFDLSVLGVEPGMRGGQHQFETFAQQIDIYHEQRDYPALAGVSRLAVHLRFGTVSIRELARYAWQKGTAGAQSWLNELIWREFYQQLLWHFPNVVHESFKPEYRQIVFNNDQELFKAWKLGQTGYPLVDAAMRQLNQTGYMHNRLRMVSASFLVKDLLLDWRWGEAYFAEKLLDFDLASNNGGWQWAASTGCDTQPYFRIFNPVNQSQKFDPSGEFIRRYVPELNALDDQAIHAPWQAKHLPAGFQLGRDYPAPIVDHAQQRERALALFGKRTP